MKRSVFTITLNHETLTMDEIKELKAKLHAEIKHSLVFGKQEKSIQLKGIELISVSDDPESGE
ncbi:MAG: hypothetical protein GY804_03855 [Alphaproteobacteria bacterium]|nr:hypothetical protein [Alphaproteobacteria bacterium]